MKFFSQSKKHLHMALDPQVQDKILDLLKTTVIGLDRKDNKVMLKISLLKFLSVFKDYQFKQENGRISGIERVETPIQFLKAGIEGDKIIMYLKADLKTGTVLDNYTTETIVKMVVKSDFVKELSQGYGLPIDHVENTGDDIVLFIAVDAGTSTKAKSDIDF